MKPTMIISVSQKILHAYNRSCEPLLRKFDLPQVSFTFGLREEQPV